METFELSMDTLRGRRGAKWNLYGKDVVPAWVADMDYTVAPVVQEVIERTTRTGDYGYPWRTGDETLQAAFAYRMKERFGWEVDPKLVQPVTECVQCMIATVMAFSAPGDGVLTMTPIYPPFLSTIEVTKRRLVETQLVDDGTRFVPDFDQMRAAIDEHTKVLLLCSPHNPTGRVWTREELTTIAEIAVAHDLIVLSDEIHADLVHDGAHIPLATISPAIAARTITITSATKAFNIAGLRAAVMHFGTEELKATMHAEVPPYLMGQISVVGVDATVTAWREAQPWLDGVMARLRSNRDYMEQFIKEEMPEIAFHAPESTYLAWLDCSALNLPETPHKFFLEHAKVGLNDGGTFGTPGTQCVRLNFATSEEVLKEVLSRMAEAVKAHKAA